MNRNGQQLQPQEINIERPSNVYKKLYATNHISHEYALV